MATTPGRRRLRVVHLVEALGLGGLERVVQALARHTDAERYQVEIICTGSEGVLAGEIRDAGTAVWFEPLGGYYPADIVKLTARLRRLRPDLLHSHGHVAGVQSRVASLLAGVGRRVHHLHTIDTSLRPRHRRLERLLARSSCSILCCSEAVARHARRDLHLPESLVVVVPNGIEPAPAVSRNEASALLGHPAGSLIGCLGSLTTHKGQAVLLQAASRLRRRVTLIFIGEGPERGRLEAMATQAGTPVVFLGALSDARRVLPALDIVVVPSIAREGLGLAALEAMDAARPVIASAVGGLPEVVADGQTGLLVPPADPQALAHAIEALLDSPELGQRLGEAGRRRVESHFRASAMVRRVEGIYEEAIGERRAA